MTQKGTAARKPLALVVEDHADMAEMCFRSLEAAGYETEVIYSGGEALAWLSESTPHIITLDLHLPGLSGETILHYVRSEARLANTRVILFTGEQRRAEQVAPNADLILLKPVTFDQLRDLALRLHPAAK